MWSINNVAAKDPLETHQDVSSDKNTKCFFQSFLDCRRVGNTIDLVCFARISPWRVSGGSLAAQLLIIIGPHGIYGFSSPLPAEVKSY